MKKKIKIIDILCYISTGEQDKVPKKFIFLDDIFEINKEAESIEKLYICLNNNCDWLSRQNFDLNDEVEILDEENEFENIEEIMLEGEAIGYGILSKWLGSEQTDKEKKLCSAIECLGVNLNALIKNQKKIIERLKDE